MGTKVPKIRFDESSKDVVEYGSICSFLVATLIVSLNISCIAGKPLLNAARLFRRFSAFLGGLSN